MTIERPMFPPVDPTRRRFLSVTAGGAAALAMPSAADAEQSADPIFVAIDAHRRADAACVAVDGDIPDELGDQCHKAFLAVVRTRPVTPAGLAALTTWVRELTDWLCANSSTLPDEEQRAIAAAVDDAVKALRGAKRCRISLHMLDREKHRGFPQKQAVWGNRRYWPAVKQWFDRTNGVGSGKPRE
jgi:hypothetical protein